MIIRQAVFLVGGRGTRLGSLASSTPKPLLEIAPGVRFIDVLIFEAARRGFTSIILLAGHLGGQVESLYQGKRVLDAVVTVVREKSAQGTAGALKHAEHLLAPWFVMANGDSLFDINLRALAKIPSSGALGRLALRRVEDAARYGSVELDSGKITQFHEKRVGGGAGGLINGGMYLLSRDILSYIRGPSSIEVDIFPALANEQKLEGVELDGYFLDIGLPDTLEIAQREVSSRMTRPAAFLDRDGVLNVDDGYTYKPSGLKWIDQAPEAIRELNDCGYYVIVVTNQAGVARGLYTEEDVGAFHQTMNDQLAELGASIDAFYHCPFHEAASVPAYAVKDHPDRKPNPGMILRALADWPIEKQRSFLVGDKESDIEAADRAGIPGYQFVAGADLLGLVREAIAARNE